MLSEPFIIKLKAQLRQPLPGQDAQYRMAPAARRRFDPESLNPAEYRASAVMILFCCTGAGEWFLPLTLRPSYNGAHSGQVSLPGGKQDPTDRDLQATAIRECYEEIGIEVEQLEVVGSLTRLYIPVSNFMVAPFVGVCRIPDPVFVPQEREVKNIVRLNIPELVHADAVKKGSIAIDGASNLRIEAPYFLSGEAKIWGATAMILSELKTVLEPIF